MGSPVIANRSLANATETSAEAATCDTPPCPGHQPAPPSGGADGSGGQEIWELKHRLFH